MGIHGEDLGLFDESLEKAREAHHRAYQSLEYLYKSGARIGLGTDLFGETYHSLQNHEFVYRSEIVPAPQLLRSATSVNAEIMQKSGQVGTLEQGAYADLLCIDQNPLEDISVMASPEKNFSGIMLGGDFVKRTF